MGANAQTTVPDFVAETVLTAAKLDISAATGVPVFATTVTRDAAFGGANKVLAEGQTCYLESTNVVQYYDGAAWATVGPSTGGLAFISGGAIPAVSTFSLPTNTFTATYRNYKLVITLSATSGSPLLTMRLRAAGADNAGTDYTYGFTGSKNDAAILTHAALNATSMHAGEANSTSLGYSATLDIIEPQLALRTNISGILNWVDDGDTFIVFQSGGCRFKLTTVFDSITLIASTGTMTGTYRVYGYTES